MASSGGGRLNKYRKVRPAQIAYDEPLSSEHRYWRDFKASPAETHYAKVASIRFSPLFPHDMAVSVSTRVEIYDGLSGHRKKTITRLKEPAYSGSFREDGRLLVAGEETGVIKVFDLGSRDVLRILKGHKQATRSVAFMRNEPFRVLSGSDDQTVRIWDMPTERPVLTIKGTHTDYVRTVKEHPRSGLLLSGGYDGRLCLWDPRTGQAAAAAPRDHGAPIEDMLVLNDSNLVLTAGGNEIRIWDLAAGAGRPPLQVLSNHQKTITALAAHGSGRRFMSAGLDHHLKIYDPVTFEVTFGFKYEAPILSMGASPDGKTIAVGTVDGRLCVRRFKAAGSPDEDPSGWTLPSDQAKLYQSRAQELAVASQLRDPASEAGEGLDSDDFRVSVGHKQKLKLYDVYFKKFQYRNALDAALNTKSAPVIVSVLEELLQRGGMQLALAGRSEASLEPLLGFLIKHIVDPRWSGFLIDLANLVLDTYAHLLGRLVLLDELIVKLRRKVEEEVSFAQDLQGVKGMLEALMSAAAGASDAPASLADQEHAAAAATGEDGHEVAEVAQVGMNGHAMDGDDSEAESESEPDQEEEAEVSEEESDAEMEVEEPPKKQKPQQKQQKQTQKQQKPQKKQSVGGGGRRASSGGRR